MWWLGLLVLHALATWQGVELIRHSDLLGFRTLRRLAWWAEALPGPARPILGPLRAVLCGWCVSIWVGLIMAALCLLAVAWGDPWGYLWLGLPLALAGSRAANLGNDLTYKWSRTPKPNEEQDGLARFSNEALEAELSRRLGPEYDGTPQSGPTGGSEA